MKQMVTLRALRFVNRTIACWFIDSSLAARKEPATELGCPADLMGDSAQMNIWLHKNVLAHIAANGGNVPQALLD